MQQPTSPKFRISMGSRDDLLMCPVCLETVEDPHVLPQCGHTFCKRCIEGAACGQRSVNCPTCRRSNQVAQARPNYALRQVRRARRSFTVAPPLAARAGPR